MYSYDMPGSIIQQSPFPPPPPIKYLTSRVWLTGCRLTGEIESTATVLGGPIGAAIGAVILVTVLVFTMCGKSPGSSVI